MKAPLVLATVMMLSACVPVSTPEVATRARIADTTLPPMKRFAEGVATAPVRANADLARDFLELSFRMESGRKLPVLTRFDGPINVAVTGKPPATLAADLASLTNRLRREAGIDIRTTRQGKAHITIEAVSRRDIQKMLPQAACFVAPNVSSLKEYRIARRQSSTDWTRLRDRRQLAIFLPYDASPQEVRDCLHEELAQAIGPLNDLYRLPDSVFNDDNVHTVLTGFDMLILRIYYDPALQSGMSEAQTAAALPGILARLNPQGEGRARRGTSATPRTWSTAIETALGRATTYSQRYNAAQDGLRIATRAGWRDHRRGFAHYTMGRVLQIKDPTAAQEHYELANRYYNANPGTELHRAYTATQMAAYAVSRGDGVEALRLTRGHLDTAKRAENAALLATLLLIRSEALALEGRADEARRVRLDSIGWARYGFGPDWAVRAKLREIAALSPRNG